MSNQRRCLTCNQLLSPSPDPAASPACPHCGTTSSAPPAWWAGASLAPDAVTPAEQPGQATWWAPSSPNSAATTPSPLPLPTALPPRPATQPPPLVPVLLGLVSLVLLAGVVAFLAIPARESSVPPEQAATAPEQLAVTPEVPDSQPAPEPEKVTSPAIETSSPAPMPAEPAPAPRVDFELPSPEKSPVKDEARKDEATPAPRPAPEPAPAARVAEQPTPPKAVVVKQHDRRTIAELRMQIEKVPEVGLDRSPLRLESSQTVAVAVQAARVGKQTDTTPRLLLARADLVGLPLLMGDACKIGPTAADHLQGGSVALRQHLFEATNGGAAAGARGVLTVAGAPAADPRPDPNKLQTAFNGDGERHNKWQKSEAVPALQQLLMAENESIREVLVEQLSKIPGERASVALAQRALFDLHPDVRRQALQVLATRPLGEYRQTLLDGFKHPWPPVADHAAEALVALDLKDTVPTLIGLLDQPDPTLPHEKPKVGLVVKEMVRVNHLLNCLMCHAPSLNQDDKVRGFVPPTSQPLPPAFSREYYAQKREGTFVRADVTYLRQDFSVPLEVKNPGKWPVAQRFDFFVRERPANLHEVAALKSAPKDRPPTEHQKSLFFALRELTGQDPGPSVEDWKKVALGTQLQPQAVRKGFVSANGLAVDTTGRVLVNDAGLVQIVRVEDGKSTVLVADAVGYNGMSLNARGQLLVAQGSPARLLRLDADGKKREVVTEGLKGKPFHHPQQVVADALGGAYLIDGPAATIPPEPGGIYYVSPHGTVTRLPIDLPGASGVALAPDGKTLYAVSRASQDVLAFALEAAGLVGKGRVLGHLDLPHGARPQGSAGLTVDARGNLFLLNPTVNGVQVMNPEGARLGLVKLPEAPIGCACSGTEGGPQTLHVLTRTTLYRVNLAGPPEPVRAVRAE